MLLAGTDDGVYRIDGVREQGDTTAEKVLDAERVWRLGRVGGVDGLFATAEAGLYYSPDGTDWRAVPTPEQPYAITADPAGERLVLGTRPARVFVADWTGEPLTSPDDWTENDGFRALRDSHDWGIPRHDGLAQVRSLRTHPDAPDRIVAGVEVGGVHVTDDGGGTWDSRTIDGFDAPHTDDIHHVELADPDTFVASTGSGLYRSTDAGRSWERLDTGLRQRYFREAFVDDGTIYAGVAPGSTASWEDDRDHRLLEGPLDGSLAPVDSPTPEEVAIGWCAVGEAVLAATHRGTLLERGDDGWSRVGTVPTPGAVRGRYLPLTWVAP